VDLNFVRHGQCKLRLRDGGRSKIDHILEQLVRNTAFSIPMFCIRPRINSSGTRRVVGVAEFPLNGTLCIEASPQRAMVLTSQAPSLEMVAKATPYIKELGMNTSRVEFHIMCTQSQFGGSMVTKAGIFGVCSNNHTTL